MNCRRFFGFRPFWKDRAQDPKKVIKMLPKVRQVGHLSFHLAPSWRHVGQLGAIFAPTWRILAPSWPTWRESGSNLAHLGAQMGSKTPPETYTFECFSQVSR
jgi:hypothetical protein